ncbi:MAG: MFS transporter [Pseudomonadales bacterium]|nr:MFS transporter [Pseudomonadales bacterium]
MNDTPGERRAERRYQLEIRRHLTRNFMVHLVHGMLGQTGFRLVNAPTFLPAYILLLSGSDIAVGVALALQALGMTLTPFFGANMIEHRKRVLPIGLSTGAAMRISILGMAVTGLVLDPPWALWAMFVWLTLFGLSQGMQGVIFNFLMSKVIPVSKRGRLTGLRNFLAGIISAGVALAGGHLFLGENPDAAGYSWTFMLAFVLTMTGLAALSFTREPEPPSVRPPRRLTDGLAGIPALLRDDPAFTRYFVARALATMGRMALPFYVLYAGMTMTLTGASLGLLTMAFTLAGTFSNLLWGLLGDRYGFRLVYLASIALWVAATLLLLVSDGLAFTTLVFVGIGAAVQGFQNASMNLTLEFGHRDDLPMRLAIANTAAELAGTIGPLAGGIIAHAYGYPSLFLVSVAFLVAGGLMVALRVPEPRHRDRSGAGH